MILAECGLATGFPFAFPCDWRQDAELEARAAALRRGVNAGQRPFWTFLFFEKVNVLRRMSVFSHVFNMCLVFRFFGLNLRSKAQDISVGFLVAFDIPARTAEAEALEATAAAFRGSGDKAWNWQRWCKMVQMCWMQMPGSCILLLKTDFGIVVLL